MSKGGAHRVASAQAPSSPQMGAIWTLTLLLATCATQQDMCQQPARTSPTIPPLRGTLSSLRGSTPLGPRVVLDLPQHGHRQALREAVPSAYTAPPDPSGTGSLEEGDLYGLALHRRETGEQAGSQQLPLGIDQLDQTRRQQAPGRSQSLGPQMRVPPPPPTTRAANRTTTNPQAASRSSPRPGFPWVEGSPGSPYPQQRAPHPLSTCRKSTRMCPDSQSGVQGLPRTRTDESLW